jgi:hypothetical protein
MTVSTFRLVSALSILLALPSLSQAVVCTWTGGNGDWNDAAKWTNGVPQDGDDALINAGQVNLTNATWNLTSFTMTGGKVTFSNAATKLTAGAVLLQGGTLTHVTNSAITTNALGEWPVYGTVWVECDTFTLEPNAWIDVLSRGFQGGGYGLSGYGPGRGGNGASHGGLGASATSPTYGNLTAPILPGSGGSGSSWGDGGDGGGAVRIDATGVVTLNGTIRASAQQGGGDRQGGGSGGSVWIDCQRIEGSGEVQADGGWVPVNLAQGGGRGGGGGRIAVLYDSEAQAAVPVPLVRFSVASGTLPSEGEPGTLYFPDNRLLYGEVVRHRGVWSVPSVTSGVAALGFDHLTISNGWLQFLNESLTLTVTNDLMILGDNKVNSGIRFFDAGRLELANGKLEVGGSATLANAGSLFLNRGLSNRIAGGGATVAGNLTLLTNCKMIVESHLTNGPALFGQSIGVSGCLEIGSNSWIYPLSHPTNGGSVTFSVDQLRVQPYGGFNADGRGYRGALASYTDDIGWGPGRGLYPFGGGSYGGRGGYQSYSTYGSLTNPAECGSSGANQASLGGNGGGLVRIESAGTVTFNGTISANGNDGGVLNSDRRGGGGSGGGVFISCATFAGTNGLIRVNGGLGRNGTYASGGGGGGRIAVLFDPVQQDAIPLPTVAFSAQGGRSATAGYMNNDTMDGSPGTLYFPDSRFLTEPIQHSGVWLAAEPVTNWTVNACMLSNVWIRFPHEGFALTVTQELRLTHAARLDLSGGVVRVGGDLILTNRATLTLHPAASLPPTLAVGGKAQFDNASFMNVYGSPTNSLGVYGATVDVAGAVTLNAGCWVWPFSHGTNGGSPIFRFGSDLLIASNAGFNAATFGCLGGINNGRGWGIGGGGPIGGGGYGGTGGVYGAGSAGRTYGSSNSPSDAGSGGASGNSQLGGAGGGLVRLEVRNQAVVNGTLNANGQDAQAYAAGGSGGGIYLSCRKLSGSGSLLARGGAGGAHANGGGGGGGGRIAVWRVMDASPQSIVRDATKGTAVQPTRLGDNGTVVMDFLHDPRGAVIVVR